MFIKQNVFAATFVKTDHFLQPNHIKTGRGEIIEAGRCTIVPTDKGDQQVVLEYSVCEEVENLDSGTYDLVKESSFFEFGSVSIKEDQQELDPESGKYVFVPTKFKINSTVQDLLSSKYGDYVKYDDGSKAVLDLYFSEDNSDENGQNLINEDSPVSRCEMVKSKIQESIDSYLKRIKDHPCNKNFI